MARFLLNLRDSTKPAIASDSSVLRLSQLSVDFATSNVIGNIGAPLDYAQAERLGHAQYEQPSGGIDDASGLEVTSASDNVPPCVIPEDMYVVEIEVSEERGRYCHINDRGKQA